MSFFSVVYFRHHNERDKKTPRQTFAIIRSLNSRCTKIPAVWCLFSANIKFFEPETDKALSTRIRFCMKTEIFFLRFGLASTCIQCAENGHRKRIYSKTLSRVESFKNAVLLYLCGCMKTEVFANDYVMVLDPVYPAHEPRRHHLAGSDISQCCLFVWMGKKRFKKRNV